MKVYIVYSGLACMKMSWQIYLYILSTDSNTLEHNDVYSVHVP